MKKLFLLLFAAIATMNFAQNLTVTSGNLDFLKDQTEINVKFIDGEPLFQAENYTEAQYLERRKTETLAKKGEAAWEKWISAWKQHSESIFSDKFVEGLNKSKKIKFSKNVDTKYTLMVEPQWMYAGWSGFITQPGKLSADMSFVETANPSHVLAEIKGDKIEGTGSKVDYGMEYGRISAAYEKTGKELEKEIRKVKK